MITSRDELKKEISLVEKDIKKDAIIFSGCCALTVASLYGTIVFGQDLIDFYKAGEILNLKTKMALDWQEFKLAASTVPGFFGTYGMVDKGKKLCKNIKRKNILNKGLK